MATPPGKPMATVSVDPSALTATVTVKAGPTGAPYGPGPETFKAGSVAAAASVLLNPAGSLRRKPAATAATARIKVEAVLPGGAKILLASDLRGCQSVTDHTPPLNAAYSYLVTAYSSDGGSAACVVAATVPGACGAVAFNYGPSYSKRAVLRLDLEEEWSYEPAGEAYTFPGVTGRGGSELPVWYPSPQLSATSSMSGCVLTEAEARVWHECLRARSPMVMRTEDGERVPVHVTGSVSRSAERYSRWDVSLDVEELARG